MKRITVVQPTYQYVETLFTLDDLIAHFERLRHQHGGDVTIAVRKDSSDTAHPVDDMGRYEEPSEVWSHDDQHRGAAIVLSIND